jgi:hypothetical protein
MLWAGLLLVISAGFAREYDGEDLLHEPWHVVIPVGASLVTSFILFCLCELHSRGRGVPSAGFWSRYRIFLTLYWMTAPLAWLYAIPIERSSTAGAAISFNLMLLKFVSLWRVILITRVISVLYDVRWWGAIFAVVLFGAAVMLAVLSFTPLPLFSIMGGIRLSEGERELASFAFGMKFLSFPIMGISFIGMLLVMISDKNRWQFAKITQRYNMPPWFWAIPAAALGVWIPLLPGPQREQRLRYVVEQDLRRGNIAAALTTLAAHDRSEFPPHWDPPPRIGYGEDEPRPEDVLTQALKLQSPLWVIEIYLTKLANLHGHEHRGIFDKIPMEQLLGLQAVLEDTDFENEFLRDIKKVLKDAIRGRTINNPVPER